MSRTVYVLASNEGLARHRAMIGGSSVYLQESEARVDLAWMQSIDGTECSIKVWAVGVVQYATQDGKVTRVMSCHQLDEVTA
jgi:hypothetical protein